MTERVLVTCRQMQDSIEHFRDRLEEAGISIVLPTLTGQQFSEDELIDLLPRASGIIAGDDPLTARVIATAQDLRVIANWGVGMDNIDLDAARRHRIVVSNNPGVFGEDVADVAAGYLVLLARRLHQIHAAVAAGEWLKVRGRRLSGCTLGVLGFGHIGRAVARRGIGFGMRVVVHDVHPAALQSAGDMSVSAVTRPELFSAADFLVLCAPLTPDTRHIVNSTTLAVMQPGSCLVNVGRGALVDESALVDALRSTRLAAAALDVFENEPLSPDSPLREFPDCIFGSHNGSNTEEGVLEASARAVANLMRDLAPRGGEAVPPAH